MIWKSCWPRAAVLAVGFGMLTSGVAQTANPDLPQAPAPTAAALDAFQRSLPAGVSFARPTGSSLPLTLEAAISGAVAHNLSIQITQANEGRIRGLQSTVLNALTPTLTATAASSAEEINLAAMGFKPQSLGPLLSQFGLTAATFQTIVKVNVTNAQINLNQQLFNLPAYYLYKASRSAGSVATFQFQNARESVALQAGTQYLRILADAEQIKNAQSQIATDQVAFNQARARQTAGVGVHLDTLRAQVQLQTEQQVLTSAEVSYDKDKIQLNRMMGVAADQKFDLVDAAPMADLAVTPHDELLRHAYSGRKDLLGLEAQRDVLMKTERAARYERLPTLAASGFYGVIGETTGLYHGYFTAQGQLQFPIFEEAQFRGEREVARAQLLTVVRQVDSLRGTIDQQIRSALLDITSSRELVRVATSNVELARQELTDSNERFAAGVDDTLPVVQAQGSLAAAENRLVQATLQYNVAKLQLGYATGTITTDYRNLLGL